MIKPGPRPRLLPRLRRVAAASLARPSRRRPPAEDSLVPSRQSTSSSLPPPPPWGAWRRPFPPFETKREGRPRSKRARKERVKAGFADPSLYVPTFSPPPPPSLPPNPTRAFPVLGSTCHDAHARPAAPTAASSLFGAKPASSTTTAPSAPAESVAGKSGGFAAVPASTTAGPSSSTPTSTAPAEPVPSLLRGKTMDDIVNTWSRELEAQVGEFRRQAGEVREWDRVLIENGKQVRAEHSINPDGFRRGESAVLPTAVADAHLRPVP